ncbi:MAG: CRTAC1 family protein [Candidatus Thiosymbion ectosymbiont of Robbea hypermnestra]|nr:CRTAC1 family protein [Candidatus Thiosymbion ectosymbiont of Robbea hypermnestra]
MRIYSLYGAVIALLLISGGCSREDETGEQKPAPAPYTYADSVERVSGLTRPLLRVEPAAELGIDFVHETGAAGDKLMPETMGPGCALFDYDGDGQLDALFTDGRPWNDQSPRPLARLYRNEGERFREVTSEAGLDAISGYGMGVAVADYDADGDADLVVTTVTGARLLRNDAGVLVDVTAAAGLEYGAPEWATSAAWLDVDQDGWLDLFVAHYVRWSPETDIFTTLDGTNKSYATPQVYEGLDNRLFRNLGTGRFADVSAEAGLVSGENKALGVVVLDVNDDRFPDLFVSNDTVANKLYVNDGAGGFTDTALLVGVGYDELGMARAGMGVDVGESIAGASMIGIGNFSNEAVSLYEQLAEGQVFIDAAQKRGIATKTLPRLTFGTRFADLNHDGRDDLILANGHIEPEIQKVQSAVTYRQPIDVFLARADGRFDSLADLTGAPVSEAVVGRCLALGDMDRDGDLDGLVSVNGGSPLILRNQTGGARAVRIDLGDPESGNREALGAEVVLSGKGWSRGETVRARGSYLGHSPYRLHFGVPRDAGDEVSVQVRWPDGAFEERGMVRVGGHYRIRRHAVF